MFLLLFNGCLESNVCSKNEECEDFECSLDCDYEKVCVNGECKCQCIGEEKCTSDEECVKLECGLPPNKAQCNYGECVCKYECETEEDCEDFACKLECKPNYNYCEKGACSCACEGSVKKFSPWEVNELKDRLKEKIITVKGTIQIKEKKCSEEDCNGNCCNQCTASLELFLSQGKKSSSIKLGGEFKGKKVQCQGNECEITCYPLKRGNSYEIQGIWKQIDKEEYFLEPIKFSLLEREKPVIESSKEKYKEGEKVKFSFDYSKKLFFLSLKPPLIYKKSNGKWREFESQQGCFTDCNKAKPVCEENVLECDLSSQCTEVNKKNAWQWNQELFEVKEIDCEWKTEGITEPVYCSEKLEAEPGIYKVKFTYAENCEEKKKLTAFSNEFTVQ